MHEKRGSCPPRYLKFFLLSIRSIDVIGALQATYDTPTHISETLFFLKMFKVVSIPFSKRYIPSRAAGEGHVSVTMVVWIYINILSSIESIVRTASLSSPQLRWPLKPFGRCDLLRQSQADPSAWTIDTVCPATWRNTLLRCVHDMLPRFRTVFGSRWRYKKEIRG